MSKRDHKKQGKNTISNESSSLSQEQLIEIQAEAYYRALKRIEEEKADAKESDGIEEENVDTKEPMQEKQKWYMTMFRVLNVLLFPWKISKRFCLKDRLYDNAIVAIISWISQVIGTLIWLVGIITITVGSFSVIKSEMWYGLFFTISSGLVLDFMGSLLILAGDDFSKEEDSGRIYAFSSSVIALISLLVSIIALLKSLQ